MASNYIILPNGDAVSADELYHWKYIKREKMPDGKWKYYYDKDALKKDAKSTADKLVDSTLSKANKAAVQVNAIVDKAKQALGKWYDDEKNIYDVTRSSYNKKLDEIKNTQEWKDIVARNDSEYVKKNSDGSTTYLVDEYLVDKKHPLLDAIGDISAGRAVTINEITKDSVVAGLKDYATTGIEIGMMAAGMLANGLSRKFKLSQGSYDDDINNLVDTANLGAQYVNTMLTDTSAAINNPDVQALASTVNKSDVEQVINLIATVDNVSRSVNENNIVEAAIVIAESDMVKQAVGSNEYYRKAENVLTNLSEEEIMAINLLIQQMRNAG